MRRVRQMRMSPSRPPDAIVSPLGETAMQKICRPCPRSVVSTSPETVSQSFSSLSRPHETMVVPLGSDANALMRLVCPLMIFRSVCAFTSHKWISPVSVPIANTVPDSQKVNALGIVDIWIE